jgi:hypothetical protein
VGMMEGLVAFEPAGRPVNGILSLFTGPYLVRLFRRLLGIYIFMLVLLPSGSIFGLNVKFLFFFLLLPAAMQMFFTRHRTSVARVLLLVLVPALLLLWFLLSQGYGFDPGYALAQYKDLLVTIISCWFASLLCAEGEAEAISFLRVVVFAEVTASSLKFLMLAYAFARGIPVTQVVELIKNVFGVSLMTLDFESMLGRIQFISDGLIPICIFAILRYRKELRFSGSAAVTMLLFLLVSDFFSFSRYFWAFGAVAVVLGLLLGKKDVFQLSLIAVLSTIVVLSLPVLTTIVELRFSSTVVTSSDQERTAQIVALNEFFADAPILGHGLGSYSHRVIRNDDAPYSYEDQLLALLGQVGIVGTTMLVVLTIYYFRDVGQIQERGIVQSVGLTVILIAWICAGFFNPEVISSAASVSYAAIAAMASLGLKRGIPADSTQSI